MSVLAIAAATSIQMAFVCVPSDNDRRHLTYIVSFEQRGDRLRRIRVTWPNGSQSRDKWAGSVEADGFVIRAEKGTSLQSLTIRLDPVQRDRAHLTTFWAVTGGHVNINETHEAECSVRIPEGSGSTA